MNKDWARERLDRLVKAAMLNDVEPDRPRVETAINVGGLSVTVSGNRTVLVIAPESSPGGAEAK